MRDSNLPTLSFLLTGMCVIWRICYMNDESPDDVKLWFLGEAAEVASCTASMRKSVVRVLDSRQNSAPTESFFNSLKNERVHGTRYETRAEATAYLFDYIYSILTFHKYGICYMHETNINRFTETGYRIV